MKYIVDITDAALEDMDAKDVDKSKNTLSHLLIREQLGVFGIMPRSKSA
jgi:hypothetical protein